MTYVPAKEQIQKMLLLYIAEEFIFPLTEEQFIKIVLDNGFMNYIEYKDCLNGLMKAKQIMQEESAGQLVYAITADGSETLAKCMDILPVSPKEAFHEYVKNNLHRIKTETLLDSSLKYLPDGQAEVTCNIRENDALLMSVKVYMEDKDAAKVMCENWEKASPVMYQIIMDTLLK